MFFKGDLRLKIYPFLWHNFNKFMEKEAFAKFRGVLISSHEVMKLKSFESGVSDVITANAQNISPLVFFLIFLLIL